MSGIFGVYFFDQGRVFPGYSSIAWRSLFPRPNRVLPYRVIPQLWDGSVLVASAAEIAHRFRWHDLSKWLASGL